MHSPIPEKTNPRQFFRRHKERGPKRFEYTYRDVAKLFHVRESTARWLGLASLEQVVSHARSQWERMRGLDLRRMRSKSRRLTEQEVSAWLENDEERAKWANRWPLYDLWMCGYPECGATLLDKGFCREHGGSESVGFDAQRHFTVLWGSRRIGLHRALRGCPEDMHVHHVDFNRWNNRLENLEILTPAEHQAKHQWQGNGPKPPPGRTESAPSPSGPS